APPEVAPGLDRLSGLVPRARSWHADPLRQLRAGPRRQIVARLPAHPRQRLVRAGLCDPSLGAVAGGVRVRHHRPGLPACDPGRGAVTGRGADIIMIDDPLKPEEALSPAQREAATSRIFSNGVGASGPRI